MPAVPPGTDGLGPRTREHLFRLEPWLANARDEHWFIQLATGGAGSDIERFVAHAASLVDPGALRVYQASVDGRRRLGVIYGEFPSRDEAAAALQSLPASLAATGAYPRQVGKLR
jgi:septal ring-binding cell division protein DamX